MIKDIRLLIDKDMLDKSEENGTEELWEYLPDSEQELVKRLRLDFYDNYKLDAKFKRATLDVEIISGDLLLESLAHVKNEEKVEGLLYFITPKMITNSNGVDICLSDSNKGVGYTSFYNNKILSDEYYNSIMCNVEKMSGYNNTPKIIPSDSEISSAYSDLTESNMRAVQRF